MKLSRTPDCTAIWLLIVRQKYYFYFHILREFKDMKRSNWQFKINFKSQIFVIRPFFIAQEAVKSSIVANYDKQNHRHFQNSFFIDFSLLNLAYRFSFDFSWKSSLLRPFWVNLSFFLHSKNWLMYIWKWDWFLMKNMICLRSYKWLWG